MSASKAAARELGMCLANVLPEHDLNAETPDLVTLHVGLIGTMAALLLGLARRPANSFYNARR